MTENHELENYRDQLRQLEKNYELATINEEMFYRLWYKWIKEKSDIRNAKRRLKRKIESLTDKNTPQ